MTFQRKPVCSKCKGEIEDNRKGKYSYCKSCHNEYARENRTKYKDQTIEQRKKVNARAYPKVYAHRGVILKQPCVVCQNHNSEAHHPEYSKPLFVVWLCRKCHTQVHIDVVQKMSELFTQQMKDIAHRSAAGSQATE